jgi:hypothetical protein
MLVKLKLYVVYTLVHFSGKGSYCSTNSKGPVTQKLTCLSFWKERFPEFLVRHLNYWGSFHRYFFLFAVLGMKLRVLCIPGKHSLSLGYIPSAPNVSCDAKAGRFLRVEPM